MSHSKPTIQDYLRLNLTRCKALGYFAPNATAEGVLTWAQGSDVIASVRFTTDTVNHRCTIAYRKTGGEQVVQTVQLRWRSSNLDKGVTWEKGRGFYYFVCPVTGRSCRNLYLVNGRFVSRHAFPHLYEQQTLSRNRRNDVFCFLTYADKVEQLEQQPRRKYTYRGKPTPFARKVERLNRRAIGWYRDIEEQAHRIKR